MVLKNQEALFKIYEKDHVPTLPLQGHIKNILTKGVTEPTQEKKFKSGFSIIKERFIRKG